MNVSACRNSRARGDSPVQNSQSTRDRIGTPVWRARASWTPVEPCLHRPHVAMHTPCVQKQEHANELEWATNGEEKRYATLVCVCVCLNVSMSCGCASGVSMRDSRRVFNVNVLRVSEGAYILERGGQQEKEEVAHKHAQHRTTRACRQQASIPRSISQMKHWGERGSVGRTASGAGSGQIRTKIARKTNRARKVRA